MLIMANKPETVLYRAPTFSLLASHGGISSWNDNGKRQGMKVHYSKYIPYSWKIWRII